MENSEKKENAWLNIGLNVIIPAVIMTKMSGPDRLGSTWSLVIALLFPLTYGLYDYIDRRKLNFFSGLGLFSVLMTGGIGLFQLNRSWMVAKETAIPLIMGLVVLFSERTKFPLVQMFFKQMMDLEKIKNAFSERASIDRYTKMMNIASRGFAL
jgi:intracellular septation protein A